MWDPGWALEQQVAVTVMVPGTCKKLCPRRSCAATPPRWAGKGLQVVCRLLGQLWLLSRMHSGLAHSVFLLMPRQAELNKENPTKVSSVVQLGCPPCACGGAGLALKQGRCRNALLGGEKSR